jgi:hypothetical protein
MLGSIGFALEVDALFGHKVEEIKKKRLKVGREQVRKILESKTHDIDATADRIEAVTKLKLYPWLSMS